MKTPGSVRSFAAAAAALSLITSSAAGAAPAFGNAAPAVASPLVALSVMGSATSRAALCGASSAAVAGAAATTAAQAPAPGCVLPALDAAPPPVVENVPPPLVAPYAPAAATNLWPLLAALGAFGAIYFLLGESFLGDDDNDGFFGAPPCTDSPC